MEFTFTDMMKRFWRFSWVIVLVMILFAGAGFAGSKLAKKNTNYAASRTVIIAKDNTNVKDPNSRFFADKALIDTYKKLAKDDAIVSSVKKALPFKMTTDEITSAVSVENPTETLMLNFEANSNTVAKAKALANTYAEVYSQVAPSLYPDMGQQKLLSKANSSDVKEVGSKSTKKMTIFGAAFGLVVAMFTVLVTGIWSNYKLAKKQG